MWLYLLLVALAWALGWLVRDRRTLPSVKDKHVFITGCDSGFGNLLARRLAHRGYRVLAACLTQKGADSLQRGCSGHLRTVLLDVTRSDSIRRAVEWVQAEVGDKGEVGGRGSRMGPGGVLGGEMGSRGGVMGQDGTQGGVGGGHRVSGDMLWGRMGHGEVLGGWDGVPGEVLRGGMGSQGRCYGAGWGPREVLGGDMGSQGWCYEVGWDLGRCWRGGGEMGSQETCYGAR